MLTIYHLLEEKETRKKLLYTVFVLLFVRLLGCIPVYGVDSMYLQFLFQNAATIHFMDLISGGSMSQLSIAAFGITSYINASIFIQLIQVLIPKLEKIGKEGTVGRKRIQYLTVAIAVLITIVSGIGLCRTYGDYGLLNTYDTLHIFIAVFCWTAGTIVILYLVLKMEDCGIGNGVSMLLTFNILTRMPDNIITFYNKIISGTSYKRGSFYIFCFLLVVFTFYCMTVILQKSAILVPIRQMRKAESVLNDEAKLPINVNISTVMPVIYASTFLYFPQTLCTIFGWHPTGYAEKIMNACLPTNWYTFEKWYYCIGMIAYIALLVVFSLFASEMNFCSSEIADNMKKSGDLILGVNPGEDTIRYLEKRRIAMALLNVAFLIVLTMVPDFLCARLEMPQMTFLGTSLIIVINTLYDTALRFRGAAIHREKKYRLFPSFEKQAIN